MVCTAWDYPVVGGAANRGGQPIVASAAFPRGQLAGSKAGCRLESPPHNRRINYLRVVGETKWHWPFRRLLSGSNCTSIFVDTTLACRNRRRSAQVARVQNSRWALLCLVNLCYDAIRGLECRLLSPRHLSRVR